jgi:TPR repeat protein
MASLGDVKFMPPKLAEYLEIAIKGGQDDDNWTSDSSARDELNEWKQQPDFWYMPKAGKGYKERKPLHVPPVFQGDLQARDQDKAAERRGEIGSAREDAALEEAASAAKAHKHQKRLRPEPPRNGDAVAQYNMGVYLASRVAEDSDHVRRAVGWFRRAARQGHRKAQYNLALCLMHGSGIPQNQTAAFALLSKAARNGHMQAEYQRALLYLHGLACGQERREDGAGQQWIVTPDVQRAIKSLARAAGGGVVAAQRELARCCMQGVGMTPNTEAATCWLLKAAEGGDGEAMVELAHVLFLLADTAHQASSRGSRNTKKSKSEVRVKEEETAARGEGGSVTKVEEAIAWLDRAANLENRDALYLSAALTLVRCGAVPPASSAPHAAVSIRNLQDDSGNMSHLRALGSWLHLDPVIRRAGSLVGSACVERHSRPEPYQQEAESAQDSEAEETRATEEGEEGREGEWLRTQIQRALEFLEKAVATGESEVYEETSREETHGDRERAREGEIAAAVRETTSHPLPLTGRRGGGVTLLGGGRVSSAVNASLLLAGCISEGLYTLVKTAEVSHVTELRGKAERAVLAGSVERVVTLLRRVISSCQRALDSSFASSSASGSFSAASSSSTHVGDESAASQAHTTLPPHSRLLAGTQKTAGASTGTATRGGTVVLALRKAIVALTLLHTKYVSSCYYICVLILLYMCPHTTVDVSSHTFICVLILLHMCPHTPSYVCTHYYVCVLIHLYLCAHTTMYVCCRGA